ncbi:MAG: AmmeMemoRadiSam system protein B [Chloroflexota bacterium]|jgi:AmmeMemoRadiSam system protein B
MGKISEVRPSPIAGLWYSADGQQLAKQIQQFIDLAETPPILGRVVGLIAPHAGHRYSGRTAGHAYRLVQGKAYDIVCVVSPLHAYFPAPVLTSAHASYATPLGEARIDRDAVQSLGDLLAEESISLTALSNDDEHSLEIQLPFLQCALASSFDLLPVMVRRKDWRMARILGAALAKVLSGRNVLLVASTDLSHFYPLQIANQLDSEMLSQFQAFSPQGVLQAEENGSGFACGAGAVATIMETARAMGADSVQVVHYSTSAEETGDTSSVVGYGAAVIYQRE